MNCTNLHFWVFLLFFLLCQWSWAPYYIISFLFEGLFFSLFVRISILVTRSICVLSEDAFISFLPLSRYSSHGWQFFQRLRNWEVYSHCFLKYSLDSILLFLSGTRMMHLLLLFHRAQILFSYQSIFSQLFWMNSIDLSTVLLISFFGIPTLLLNVPSKLFISLRYYLVW